jgi:CRISPR-associated protein Cas1
MEAVIRGLAAADDSEWLDRSRHWANHGTGPKDKRVRRQPRHDPLILAGHGVSLRIEAGTLLVRNGFTHYPQKQETFRFFKRDADLPPRIILLDGSGSMSFDVLTWLNEQKVPLVKIDWAGNAVTVISGGDSFAASRELVAWQTKTRSDPRKRMDFCNALIAKKIEGCVLTMETSLRRSAAFEAAMRRATTGVSGISCSGGHNGNEGDLPWPDAKSLR